MKLSPDFELKEFTDSEVATQEGIDNTPNETQIKALKYLVNLILQPARTFLKFKIDVNSGFRCPALNLHPRIKGSKTSQHPKGEAADLECQDNAKLFFYIKERCTFDQLIWEMGDDNQPAWVHVSAVFGRNRGEVLRAEMVNGEKTYKQLL